MAIAAANDEGVQQHGLAFGALGVLRSLEGGLRRFGAGLVERHELDGDRVAAVGVDPGRGLDEVAQLRRAQIAARPRIDRDRDRLTKQGSGRRGGALRALVDRVGLRRLRGLGGAVAVGRRNRDVVGAEHSGIRAGAVLRVGPGLLGERGSALGRGVGLFDALVDGVVDLGDDGHLGVARADDGVEHLLHVRRHARLVVARLLVDCRRWSRLPRPRGSDRSGPRRRRSPASCRSPLRNVRCTIASTCFGERASSCRRSPRTRRRWGRRSPRRRRSPRGSRAGPMPPSRP